MVGGTGVRRVGRRHRWSATVAVLPLLLIAAACSVTGSGAGDGMNPPPSAPTQGGSGNANTDQAPPRPAPPQVVISPANGSQGVSTVGGITVTVPHGRLERVDVATAGWPVTGTYSLDGKVWHSRWALDVSQHYTVTAVGLDAAGHRVTATSSFSTLAPQQTFTTQIFEGYDLTYGVGMPIELDFDHPITNEAAVERSLQIFTSKPVVGGWYWNGDQQVDFRPRTYWPVGTKVSFIGHLDGVEGANGVYGTHTLTQSFYIGRSLIVVAGTQTHYMDVYLNGAHLYHWPISTGRATLPTPNGTYLSIEKANPQNMVGPGYNIEVPWSVRFTLSGDFLHDAYWSVGVQGVANVSHGCVNMPPADAEIYYNMSVPGDPVTITGSPAAGTFGDGWTEWFLTWSQIVAGSALHEAVQTTRAGSYFVNPALLPAVHASAPLETSTPGNSLAA